MANVHGVPFTPGVVCGRAQLPADVAERQLLTKHRELHKCGPCTAALILNGDCQWRCADMADGCPPLARYKGHRGVCSSLS